MKVLGQLVGPWKLVLWGKLAASVDLGYRWVQRLRGGLSKFARRISRHLRQIAPRLPATLLRLCRVTSELHTESQVVRVDEDRNPKGSFPG